MRERAKLKSVERYGKRAVAGLSMLAVVSCGVEAHGSAIDSPSPVASSIDTPTSEIPPVQPLPDFESLEYEWKAELSHDVGEIDAAIVDLHTGEMMQASSGETPDRFYAASVMKLSILVETLRQYQEQGMPVDICYDDANQWLDQCQALDMAYPMITVSDNDSASQYKLGFNTHHCK